MEFREEAGVEKCKAFWKEQSWQFAERKTILAVSGGKDSIFLFHLFRQLGFPFAVAHVNYKLRGNDSDQDEDFVTKLCVEHGIPLFLKIDDLKSLKQGGANIQISARKSRYKFFQKLTDQLNYDYLATAHHSKDNLETVLINLGRGTGPQGLMGIPTQYQKIVRPILRLESKYIEEWLTNKNLNWREDKSNASDDYLRNKTRHHIVPPLLETMPNIYKSLELTQNIISENIKFIAREIDGYKSKMLETADGFLNLEILKDHPSGAFILYSILKEDGINRDQSDTLFHLIGSTASKVIKSSSQQFLLKETQLWKRSLQQNEIEEFE